MSFVRRNPNWTISTFLAMLALFGVLYSQTQQPGVTPVQQAQPLYTCNQTATATGAANTAVTLTTNVPPAGQFVYVCSIDITEAANAAVTGAAGPAPIFTTTNLQNQLVWWGNNATQTTGQNTAVLTSWPGHGLLVKGASPGVAVTIVTSAGQSTDNVRLNMTYLVAP